MKRFISASIAASLLLISSTPLRSEDSSAGFLPMKTQDGIQEFNKQYPWITEEYCMKKESYQSAIGSDKWERCRIIIVPQINFLLRKGTDFTDHNIQDEWVNVMSDDALFSWYYSSLLYNVYWKKGEVDELRELRAGTYDEDRISGRKQICQEIKTYNNYYKKNNQSTSPMQAYCLSLSSRSSANNINKSVDSSDINLKAYSTDNKEAHKQCKNTADYEGCMRYQVSK